MNTYQITFDGAAKTDITDFGQDEALVRAVMISLFTWRRANPDDVTEGQKMGWFGDVIEPPAANDKIGSRLWLLSREKVIQDTINRAREYAQEALDHLVDDGVATKVVAVAERLGLDGIAVGCDIYREEGGNVALRFNDAWSVIRGV